MLDSLLVLDPYIVRSRSKYVAGVPKLDVLVAMIFITESGVQYMNFLGPRNCRRDMVDRGQPGLYTLVWKTPGSACLRPSAIGSRE